MLTDEARARRTRAGRRLGLVVFAIPVAGATLIWTLQIIRQVFRPAFVETSLDCRPAVLGLDRAVRRAREAAAAEIQGERPALQRFRDALGPEWANRPNVTRACQGDPAAIAALSDLDALRYAEEHAVRYEAVALAKQRRRSDAIRRELTSPAPVK
ncbi:MAG TPA: hypothetical protein VG937_21320 [Polyangiaceae bacterium]|jgi:hypothetical protein|nr:hypothetical protein [Polyangiaceae bacterium]